MPLTSSKIEHTLAIGDFYLYLNNDLQNFIVEPQEKFSYHDKEMTYYPDAFFIYQNKAYLLEVQLHPLSSDRWSDKWQVANKFFESGAFKKASWINNPTRIFKPRIVVYSPRQYDKTILSGCNQSPLIVRSIEEFCNSVKM